MKTNNSLSGVLPLITGILAVFIPFAGNGTDLASQKLFGRWANTPDNYFLGQHGTMAALTEKWAVVSTHQADDRGAGSDGAVQVFNAVTGAWVRRIHAPGPPAGSLFGAAVAVSGDTALIGAPGQNGGLGAAFVVNLSTGAVLRTLTGPGIMSDVRFGWSVAILADTLAVGAYNDDGGKGAVYLFRATTGAFITKLTAAGGGPMDAFGKSLAGDGTILAVGAPQADADRGAVYFYDQITGALIDRHQPATSVAGNQVGFRLAMQGGYVVMGGVTGRCFRRNLALDQTTELLSSVAVGSSFSKGVAISGSLIAVGEPAAGTLKGAVHLFRTEDGAFLQRLTAPLTPDEPLEFGSAIALDGNTLLASAPADSTQESGAGAAFLLRPLSTTMRYDKVIAQGDAAPTVPEVSVGKIGDVFINSDGETLFSTSLGGAGSNGGKDSAAITEVSGDGTFTMPMKSRLPFGSSKTGAVSRLTMNDIDVAVGAVTLTGPGMAAPANQMIWASIAGSFGTLVIPGQTSASFGGGRFASVPEFVTSNQLALGQVALMVTLKQQSSTGINAGNDSGLLAARLTGMVTSEVVRENAAAPAALPPGTLYGQFAPRVSWFNNRIVFSTALKDGGVTTANNAAVFTRDYATSTALTAQKGDDAVDEFGMTLGGVRYSSFIGETASGTGSTFYRATLSGVPATTNEGIWSLDSGGVTRKQWLRKGGFAGVAPTGKVSRVLAWWATRTPDQLMAWVVLTGPGITPANDQALILIQSDMSVNTLLQEGQAAPGCGTARIGTIQRVEVDPWDGAYAVLLSLTGSPAGSNQALGVGNVYAGNNTSQSALRRPFLRLRKGQLFTNQPGKLRSISLPTSNRPASGAGGTGRGRAISWSNDFTFVAEFDNKVRQIMKGGVD